jgi:hypothetical protein
VVVNQLDPVRLGLAAGVIGGVGTFLTTLFAIATGYAHEYLLSLASIYPGYDVSVNGSVLGLVYGFLGGFIGLFLLGWVYNLLGPKKE